MNLAELVAALRGQVARAVVRRVDDTGNTQVADVQTHDGVLRGSVEVYQPAGFASAPPAAGGLALVLAVGGDQGDMVVLPVSAPSSRMGALAPGEAAIYAPDGTRVHVKANGEVHVHARAKVFVQAPVVQIVAAGGVEITGDLRVSGQVSDAAGSMQEMRDRYNAHQGHGTGGGPSPPMD